MCFQVFFVVICVAYSVFSTSVIQSNRENPLYWLLSLLCLFLLWEPIAALFYCLKRKNIYEARLLLPEVGHGMQIIFIPIMILLMYDIKNGVGNKELSWRIIEFPTVLMVFSHFLGVSTDRWRESLDFLFESVVDYADILELLEDVVVVKNNPHFVRSILVFSSISFCLIFSYGPQMSKINNPELEEEQADGLAKDLALRVTTLLWIFQDFSFLIMRFIIWLQYDKLDLFFVLKNAIFVVIDFGRLWTRYGPHIIKDSAYEGETAAILETTEKLVEKLVDDI